jgi:deazaflavin-dependent oxidoreductase (nitroreductase family)
MSASSPYRKPGGFRKVVNRTVARLGLAPTLAVRGRKSGQWRTVAVFVLEQDGTRYLIAPRGETQWARNLRATKEGELRHRGRVEQFRAVELPDTDKPTLIEAYVNRFGTAERPTSVRSRTSWVVRRPYSFSRISARQTATSSRSSRTRLTIRCSGQSRYETGPGKPPARGGCRFQGRSPAASW